MAAMNAMKFYFSKPIVFVLGCTGTGKSKLAIEMAKRFNGEIINADAMQMYQGLDIITNKVTETEQQGIRHHLLGFVNPLKKLTVCEYKNLALQAIKDVIDRKKLPIVVGGTFYYAESILYDFIIGIPELDDQDQNVEKALEGSPPRKKLKVEEYEELVTDLNKLDNEKLYNRLREVDSDYADTTHPNARRKVLRAIMVYLQHGETLTSLLKKQRSQPGGGVMGGPLIFKNSILLWLHCDPEVLLKRLDDRVDDMLSRGLLDEILEFHKSISNNDLQELIGLKGERTGVYQSIGFKEFYEFLILEEENRKSEKGRKILEKGVEMLKIHTRQYAKRQERWLKNRLLKDGTRQVPPIYSFDVTDVSKWKENVYTLAENVVDCHLAGNTPQLEPMPAEKPREVIDRLYKCECGTIAVGKNQYEIHLASNKHKRKMKKLKKEEKDETTTAATTANG